MEFSSTLDDVVYNLENDVNKVRIKKLILFACQGIWENDPHRLEGLDLRRLVQDLVAVTGTPETLESVINSIASKLNKKTEYALVAKVIIIQVSRLFPRYDEPTVVEASLSNLLTNNSSSNSDSSNGRDTNFQPQSEAEQLRYQYDLFPVRMKILQQTNPLRSKILIFSLFYHSFNFNDRDWLVLKSKGLEELLQRLFTVCNSAVEVENKLSATAQNFRETDDYHQTISTIVEALVSSYETVGRSDYAQENYPKAHNQFDSDNDQTALENPLTYHPSDHNFESNDLDETALNSQLYQQNAIANNQTMLDDQHFQPDHLNTAGFSLYSNSGNSNYYNQNATENGDGENYDDIDETVAFPSNVKTTNPYPEAEQKIGLKVSDAIRQKLSLEEQIKNLVNQSSRSILEVIENTVSDLEKDLDWHLQNQSPTTKIDQKYQVLRDFLHSVQTTCDDLLNVIQQLEIKERQVWGNDKGTTVTNQPVSATQSPPEKHEDQGGTTPEPGSSNQQKVLQLAKQGNGKAIVALLNQRLKNQGITVTAMIKETTLQVILESAEVPEQNNIVPLVQQNLVKWQIAKIRSVKLYGRQTGNKSPAWSQELNYP